MAEGDGISGVELCIGPDGAAAPGVYRVLRDMVHRHSFLPGQRLDQRQLAKRLGVSTTLIRDACNRLAAENFLSHLPSKGFFVKPLSASDLADAYELASALLCFSIHKRGSDFTLEGLRHRPALARDDQEVFANVPSEVARQYGAFVEALFERIVSLAGNKLAVRALRLLLDHTRYLRERDLHDRALLGAVDADVTALQAALSAGERQEAIAAIRRLLERMVARLPDLVRKVQLEDLHSTAALLALPPDD